MQSFGNEVCKVNDVAKVMEMKFSKLWKWSLQTYKYEVCEEMKFAKLWKWSLLSCGNEGCKVLELSSQTYKS